MLDSIPPAALIRALDGYQVAICDVSPIMGKFISCALAITVQPGLSTNRRHFCVESYPNNIHCWIFGHYLSVHLLCFIFDSLCFAGTLARD